MVGKTSFLSSLTNMEKNNDYGLKIRKNRKSVTAISSVIFIIDSVQKNTEKRNKIQNLLLGNPIPNPNPKDDSNPIDPSI